MASRRRVYYRAEGLRTFRGEAVEKLEYGWEITVRCSDVYVLAWKDRYAHPPEYRIGIMFGRETLTFNNAEAAIAVASVLARVGKPAPPLEETTHDAT